MKGTWMLLVLAILLLFGPGGPLMADGRTLIMSYAAEAEGGMSDRILPILLPAAMMHAAWHWDRKRRADEA